jgi:hypothetical protein
MHEPAPKIPQACIDGDADGASPDEPRFSLARPTSTATVPMAKTTPTPRRLPDARGLGAGFRHLDEQGRPMNPSAIVRLLSTQSGQMAIRRSRGLVGGLECGQMRHESELLAKSDEITEREGLSQRRCDCAPGLRGGHLAKSRRRIRATFSNQA